MKIKVQYEDGTIQTLTLKGNFSWPCRTLFHFHATAAEAKALMPLTLQSFDLYEIQAVISWPQKSSVAELPLTLTWNIYAFSGSFRRKERAFRMTARYRGEN